MKYQPHIFIEGFWLWTMKLAQYLCSTWDYSAWMDLQSGLVCREWFQIGHHYHPTAKFGLSMRASVHLRFFKGHSSWQLNNVCWNCKVSAQAFKLGCPGFPGCYPTTIFHQMTKKWHSDAVLCSSDTWEVCKKYALRDSCISNCLQVSWLSINCDCVKHLTGTFENHKPVDTLKNAAGIYSMIEDVLNLHFVEVVI